MSEQHTPGRLSYEYEPGYCGELIASNGTTIATFNDEPIEANARRLVACWNACEGIDTEYLEGYDSLPHYARRLMAQRDELLAALEGLTGDIQALIGESDGVAGLHMNGDVAPWGELEAGGRFERLTHLPTAHAAIAKVEGGAA